MNSNFAWLAMLNFQEPSWFDHLTSSVPPRLIIFSSMLFTFGRSGQRNHLQRHGGSLATMWYEMASVHEPCEGSRHFIKNGCSPQAKFIPVVLLLKNA